MFVEQVMIPRDSLFDVMLQEMNITVYLSVRTGRMAKNGEEHHTRDKLTGWLITVEVRYTVIETCKRCNQGKD